MAYNKAREEIKWKQWKEKEEEQMRMLGMNEDAIRKLRDSDWRDFKAERCYQEHRAIFPEYPDNVSMEMEEREINGIATLLDSVGDERLLQILLASDKKTLQLILLKMMGYSVTEIAIQLRLSERAVYCRIDRLKKKLKKFYKKREKRRLPNGY